MKKHKKVSIKRPEGAPAKFLSPEDMEAAIERYFDSCPDKRTVVSDGVKIEVPSPTISGLSLFLGFSDRHSMYDYEKRPQFSHTIKKARTRITKMYEMNMMGQHCVGSIFMLKNLGYADKTEVESKHEVKSVQEVIVKYENMTREQLTEAIMSRINGHKSRLN